MSSMPMIKITTAVRDENDNDTSENTEQQVRDILVQLQNFDVPIEYRTIDNEEDTSTSTAADGDGMNDEELNDSSTSNGINNTKSNSTNKDTLSLLDRYMIARDEYITRRMKVLLLEHVKTYNGTSFTLPAEYVVSSQNNDEKQIQLKEEINTKINQVQSKSQQIHNMKQQLSTLYNQLQTKQQYYQNKINEYDSIQVDNNNNNNNNNENNTIIITESIVQEQDNTIQSLQLKQTTITEQLKSIREQNIIIQQQLHTKRLQQQPMIQKYRTNNNNNNNNNNSTTANDNNTMLSLLFNNTNTNIINTSGMDSSSSLDDNEQALVSLEQLKDKYNNMKDKVTTYQQAQDMYTNLRTVLETIYQLKIISIEPIQLSKSVTSTSFSEDKENNHDMIIINNNNTTSSSTNNQQKMIQLTIEIFHKHIIQICIRSSTNSGNSSSNSSINTSNDVQVDSAILMSDAIIKGRTVTGTSTLTTPDKLQQPTVQMKIPKFDDIIQYAKTLRQQQQQQLQYSNACSSDNHSNNNLKFVIQEIMSRCLMIEQRVQILSQLQNIVLTQIGNIITTTSSSSSNDITTYTTFGTTNEQEVICSFNDEQITVLLKLTCDCPFTNNSVYIDQLVGFGGWDQDELDIIKDTINNISHSNNDSNGSKSSIEQLYNNNPVTVTRSLQKKIHSLLQQKQHSQQDENNTTTTGSTGTPNDHNDNNITSKVIFPPTPALPNKKKQRRIQ